MFCWKGAGYGEGSRAKSMTLVEEFCLFCLEGKSLMYRPLIIVLEFALTPGCNIF